MAKQISQKERIITLARLAGMARRHYELWRVYTSPETRPLYLDAMQSFADFFALDEHAHRSLAILNLAAFFDSDNRAVRLGALLQEFKMRDSAAIEAIEKRRHDAQQTISKVLRIRHGAIAHRSDRMSYDAVFEGAALTADELEYLVSVADSIADELSTIGGVDRPLIANYAVELLKSLLEQLSVRSEGQ